MNLLRFFLKVVSCCALLTMAPLAAWAQGGATEAGSHIIDRADTSWFSKAKPISGISVDVGFPLEDHAQKAIRATEVMHASPSDRAKLLEAVPTIKVPSHGLFSLKPGFVPLTAAANTDEKVAAYFQDFLALNAKVGNTARDDFREDLDPAIILIGQGKLVAGPLFCRDWNDAITQLERFKSRDEGLLYDFLDQGIHILIQKHGGSVFVLMYDWEQPDPVLAPIRLDAQEFQHSADIALQRTRALKHYLESHDLGIVTKPYS